MAEWTWADSANRALSKLFSDLPRGLSEKDLRVRCREAYPFGIRRYLPYKVWLREAKRWRVAYANGLKGPMPGHYSFARKHDVTDPNQERFL